MWRRSRFSMRRCGDHCSTRPRGCRSARRVRWLGNAAAGCGRTSPTARVFRRGGAFRGLAKALDLLVNGALALVHPPPIDPPLRFNDLILQRYELGSRGITPHRDHVRYVGLVAIVVLSGSARFFVCADRTAHDAHEVPAPPGHLLLMRAPGFHGRRDRPFHFLTDVKARRYAFAVRHDAAPN